jgi:hypothetical protein
MGGTFELDDEVVSGSSGIDTGDPLVFEDPALYESSERGGLLTFLTVPGALPLRRYAGLGLLLGVRLSAAKDISGCQPSKLRIRVILNSRDVFRPLNGSLIRCCRTIADLPYSGVALQPYSLSKAQC